MTEVKFYEGIADERLAFAVILSKAQGAVKNNRKGD